MRYVNCFLVNHYCCDTNSCQPCRSSWGLFSYWSVACVPIHALQCIFSHSRRHRQHVRPGPSSAVGTRLVAFTQGRKGEGKGAGRLRGRGFAHNNNPHSGCDSDWTADALIQWSERLMCPDVIGRSISLRLSKSAGHYYSCNRSSADPHNLRKHSSRKQKQFVNLAYPASSFSCSSSVWF